MKKLLIFLFLLSACNISQENKSLNLQNLNISDKLSLNEFKLQLEKYANSSPYPSIEN